MAQVKMLSPSTTLWWIPTVGVVNPQAPTSAEVNAAVNISCAVMTGYTLNFTDPDTDDSKSICDVGNVKNPTFENYEGSLTFFRSAIGNPTAVFTSAFGLFKKAGARGYIARRLGKPNTAAAAVGDTLTLFGFESDVPTDQESDSGGPIQLTVKYLPQGDLGAAQNFTLVA